LKMIGLLLCLAMGTEVTPVQKVLAMMDSMLEKGKAEAAAEQAAYQEYSAWCDATGQQKEKDIADATVTVDRLRAAVQKAKADVARLGGEIEQLDTDLATAAGDKAAATKLRDTERADYETVHADYVDNVESLEEALRNVQAGPKAVTNLAQLSERAQSLLSGPPGNAFESSSGMIEDLVGGLLTKMRDEKAAFEKEEQKKANEYDELMQELTTRIDHMTDERDEKTQMKGRRSSDAARDSTDLAETVKTRTEDRKYVAELKAECGQKATDMEARTKLRAEEIVAVNKAREIIGGRVAGNAEKHLPSLVQRSLMQLRATTQARTARAAMMLQSAAQRTGSKALAALALRTEDGPFDKVLGMIKGMIKKLSEQASEEADHKGWCDGELHSNKNTRDSKTTAVNELTAQSEQLNAEIAELTEEMAELSRGIAQLDKAMAEATSQRQEEHARNDEAVRDAKEAQAAVREALAVLKKFYAKAATATALAQTKARISQPASFDTPYQGMGGESGGVVGMLEVILSDFVRLEEETQSSENEASSAFDEFSAETNTDKTAKSDAYDSSKTRKIKQQRALQQASRDLSETQKGLDAALQYFSELKPACLDAGVDFAERSARRQEEVESLEQALGALGGE